MTRSGAAARLIFRWQHQDPMLIITNQPEGYVIEWEVGIFHRLRDHGGVAVAVLHSQRRAACFRIYRQTERVNNNETAGLRD